MKKILCITFVFACAVALAFAAPAPAASPPMAADGVPIATVALIADGTQELGAHDGATSNFVLIAIEKSSDQSQFIARIEAPEVPNTSGTYMVTLMVEGEEATHGVIVPVYGEMAEARYIVVALGGAETPMTMSASTNLAESANRNFDMGSNAFVSASTATATYAVNTTDRPEPAARDVALNSEGTYATNVPTMGVILNAPAYAVNTNTAGLGATRAAPPLHCALNC